MRRTGVIEFFVSLVCKKVNLYFAASMDKGGRGEVGGSGG